MLNTLKSQTCFLLPALWQNCEKVLKEWQILNIEGSDSDLPSLALSYRQYGYPALCEIISHFRTNFLGIDGRVEEVGMLHCSCWVLVLLLVARLH